MGAVTVPVLAEDIKWGHVGPEDLSLDTECQQTSVLEDLTKKPWYDLWNFLKTVRERRHTTGLKVTRKKRSRSTEEVNELNSIAVSHSVSSAPVERDNGVDSEQKKTVKDRCAGLEDSPPGTAEEDVSTCSSSSKTPHTPATAALLADRVELETAEVKDLVANHNMAETSTEATIMSGGSDWEAFLEPRDDRSEFKMMIDDIPDMPTYSSPRTIQNTDWYTSAVTIKDGQGVEHAEKLFYDTGSDVNLSTPKFAFAHRLEQRPIRPDDVKIYDVPNGSITPTHYIEMEMKDPKRGIKDFVRIRFVMAATLGGIGLLLGRGFMHQYKIVLDPTPQGSGTYTVTARAPGPG